MLQEIKDRWMAESPIFWINVKSWCIKIGIAAASIIGSDKLFDLQSQYGVSPIVFTVCGYIIAICFGLGFGAQITKK